MSVNGFLFQVYKNNSFNSLFITSFHFKSSPALYFQLIKKLDWMIFFSEKIAFFSRSNTSLKQAQSRISEFITCPQCQTARGTTSTELLKCQCAEMQTLKWCIYVCEQESALYGEHIWFETNVSGDFCYVGEQYCYAKTLVRAQVCVCLFVSTNNTILIPNQLMYCKKQKKRLWW